MFFLLSYVLLLLKTCNRLQICCSGKLRWAFSSVCIIQYTGIDKLVDINYSEKSLKWAEINTDSDFECELWLIARCCRLAVVCLCFIACFCFFYSQVKVFNIYATERSLAVPDCAVYDIPHASSVSSSRSRLRPHMCPTDGRNVLTRNCYQPLLQCY